MKPRDTKPTWTDVKAKLEQALKACDALPQDRGQELLVRLDSVRRLSHNFGYGVGDEMDDLLAGVGFDVGSR
jgi:hypothetical protein